MIPQIKNAELGLAIGDNLFILMEMDGTTRGFDLRCPTL